MRERQRGRERPGVHLCPVSIACSLVPGWARDHVKSGEDSLAISFRNCNQFCLFEGEGVVGETEF